MNTCAYHLIHVVIVLTSCALPVAAWAGRPLSVDDAATNNVSQGHVEAWLTKTGDGSGWSLSAAYAVAAGVEPALAFSKDRAGRWQARGAQLKVLLGAQGNDVACRKASSIGWTRVATRDLGGQDDVRTLTGIVSCQLFGGDAHGNVGVSRQRGLEGLRIVTSAGVAWEYDLQSVVVHVEALFATGAKPAWGVGTRLPLTKNFQLDGSRTVQQGSALTTLGVKWQF